jgi:hypothetical protein
VHTISRHLTVITIVMLLALQAAGASDLPSPESAFGFSPGADHQLVDYEQLIDYLTTLADASDRIELREVGSSPEGRPMFVAFLSSPANLQRLDELKEINRRLALDTDLTVSELEQLVNNGRVFVMETLSMHSSEVAPSQTLPLFAFEIAGTGDPAILDQLERVVLMIVPCHNPDGMDKVVTNYRKYRGTRYEASTLPGVYHRYVGHDNNRDFVTLTQDDTRVINRLYSTEWFPQVLVEKHQMGQTGPRYSIPENHDPIAENIDESLWNWSAVFGARLQQDMARDGLNGVASHWLFDNYWPGSTETSLWKNVISFLTEAASCKTATPVYVEPNELQVRGKGLAEYAKSVNMTSPWKGGWWRLGDIVRYELSSHHSILSTAASLDKEILRSRNVLSAEEVERGRTQAPFHYVLPLQQTDRAALPNLVSLLEKHGIEVKRLNAGVEVNGRVFPEGSVVISLAQPYRAFIKEVMEDQSYPVRHYVPDGKVIRPYDITSWSLPRHRGLVCHEVTIRSTDLEAALEDLPADFSARSNAPELPKDFAALAWPAGDNAAHVTAWAALQNGLEVQRLTEPLEIEGLTLGAGSFVITGSRSKLNTLTEDAATPPVALPAIPETPMSKVDQPRIALVESWFHDMDAGWTRFILDQAGIPFTVVRPGDIEETDLEGLFDVVLFPDQSKEVLREGRRKRGDHYSQVTYPPEFTKAISDDAMKKLAAWIDGGGIVVSWGRSTGIFLDTLEIPASDKDQQPEKFQLPVQDISKKLKEKGLLVPGAFLAVDFLPNHPLTWGMPSRGGIFSRGAPVFKTSIPVFDMDRRVIATHPKGDVLLSGYAEHGQLLANTTVMVWLRKNRGQLILMGFSPQFRASTPATTKLLFNALLLPPVDPG